MAIFEVWDIVKVPFPYTDRPVRQRRPGLVVAAGEIETAHGLLWLVMITSAENRGWPGDVAFRISAPLVSPPHRSCAQRRSPRWMPEMHNGSARCPAPIEKPLPPVCVPCLAPCSCSLCPIMCECRFWAAVEAVPLASTPGSGPRRSQSLSRLPGSSRSHSTARHPNYGGRSAPPVQNRIGR